MGKKIIKTLSLGVLGGGKKKAADPAPTSPQPEITPLNPSDTDPRQRLHRRPGAAPQGSILGGSNAGLSGTLGG